MIIFITSDNLVDKESFNRLMLKYKDEDFVTDTLLNKFNYKGKVEVDDIYSDCIGADFDEDLTFSVDKYNNRKQRENNQLRINEIKPRLEQLSQDLIQAQAGAVFEDLEERKLEFQTLHNELRVLLGKEPRNYAEVQSE